MAIEPNHGRNIEEFDDIDPSLSGFDVGHEWLMTPKATSNVGLSHAGIFAISDQELGEASVAR